MEPEVQTQRRRKPRKLNPTKVQALALTGLPISDIAKHQNVHPTTIWRFLKNNYINETKDLIKEYTDNRPFYLRIFQCNDLELHNRIVTGYLRMDEQTFKAVPDQIKRGLIDALNNSFGTKYDKERLESGKSTQNIAYADAVRAMNQAKADLEYSQEIRRQRQSDMDFNTIDISPTLDSQGIEDSTQCG